MIPTELPHAGPLPVAVIGCGRMGRHHARAYSQMPQVKLVGVLDASPAAAQAVAAECSCRAFADIEQLIPHVAAVTVAVPTQHHLSAAEPLLRRGIPCLIEKPLAPDVATAQRIVDCAKKSGVIVQVGHIERFNPAVLAMRKLDTRPRFFEVVRISPMTFRSIDVGVVLDMMIHDIDIVLMLAGAKPSRVEAVGVSVIGQVEDICNARVTFENGLVANLTASRLAWKTERKMRAFSPEAYVSIDYQKREGIVVHRAGNLEAIRDVVQRVRAGEITDLSQLNYQGLVKMEPLATENLDPLRTQLASFVDAVRNKSRPEISGEDGLAAVALAEKIVQSIAPGMSL